MFIKYHFLGNHTDYSEKECAEKWDKKPRIQIRDIFVENYNDTYQANDGANPPRSIYSFFQEDGCQWQKQNWFGKHDACIAYNAELQNGYGAKADGYCAQKCPPKMHFYHFCFEVKRFFANHKRDNSDCANKESHKSHLEGVQRLPNTARSYIVGNANYVDQHYPKSRNYVIFFLEEPMSIHIVFNSSKSQQTEATSTTNNTDMLTQMKIKKEGLKANLFLESVLDLQKSATFGDYAVVYRDLAEGQGNNRLLFSGFICKDPIPTEEGLLHLFFQGNLGESLSEKPESMRDENTLDESIFEGTIKQSQIPLPPCINVNISAEWVQKNTGCTDIGEYIANKFPNRIISSLNSDFSVQQQSVKKTGYTTLAASFTPILPAQTGCLDIYKASTPSFETDDGEESLPYYWFSCSYKIDWNYEQKRVETLSFSLPFFDFTNKSSGDDEPTDFFLKVTDLEKLEGFDERQSSFFDTELGKKVAVQCIETVKEKVIAQKSGTIVFEMDFDRGCDLAIGQMVKIEKLQLSGRISQVELVADGPYRHANITLISQPQWFEGWGAQQWRISEVCEETPLEGFKIEGLKNSPLSHKDIVESVTVEDPADAQSAKLLQRRFRDAEEARDFIKETPTRITVRLRDLRTQKVLLHSMVGHLEQLDKPVENPVENLGAQLGSEV
jgi:hypothetical protein